MNNKLNDALPTYSDFAAKFFPYILALVLVNQHDLDICFVPPPTPSTPAYLLTRYQVLAEESLGKKR